ncbi:MAG: site-specific integrase [Polyangiaceae bacterium]
MRFTFGSLGRKCLSLPTCATPAAAEQRRELVMKLARRLVNARCEHAGWPLLEQVASSEGEALRGAVDGIGDVLSGDVVAKPTGETTLRELGERWTSGELARLYPDNVTKKKDKSARDDASRLALYVYPLIGALPVRAVELAQAQLVMSRIPPGAAPATRRHVAQVLHKLLAFALYPLCIIKSHPLPKGFLPKLGPPKAKGYLYPADEARLLGLRDEPLAIRVLYGLLAREGMRSWSEAATLARADVDLDNEVLTLDINKTDDPRAWTLRPDTARALRIWTSMLPPDQESLFPSTVFESKPVQRLRERLKKAGITRPELFKASDRRIALRVHDLRGTFVTLALANGKNEAWVQDRTGHKSSVMINRYRRAARTAAEAGLGDLHPLDLAIPELREMGEQVARAVASFFAALVSLAATPAGGGGRGSAGGGRGQRRGRAERAGETGAKASDGGRELARVQAGEEHGTTSSYNACDDGADLRAELADGGRRMEEQPRTKPVRTVATCTLGDRKPRETAHFETAGAARVAFKIRCSRERVGSSPTGATRRESKGRGCGCRPCFALGREVAVSAAAGVLRQARAAVASS